MSTQCCPGAVSGSRRTGQQGAWVEVRGPGPVTELVRRLDVPLRRPEVGVSPVAPW